MSGGHFNYDQYRIEHMAQEIQRLIETNGDTSLDDWGYKRGRSYSPETIQRFREAEKTLRLAALYTQRIDWLVSDDDGEDSFHERLAKELEKFE